MIEAVLPGVAAAETFGDDHDELLYPEEEAAISRAVAKRRDEFRTVRACARRALRELGLDRPPLVPGTHGAPSWPPSVAGSMTHCTGYRAAAVAWRSAVASLGIDAEPDEPVPAGVLASIALPAELARVDELTRTAPGTAWDRLLFSAKESVYKAWYPLTRRWLGFEEARLSLDPCERRFTAELLVPGPTVAGQRVGTFTGTWTVGRGLVVTAVRVEGA